MTSYFNRDSRSYKLDNDGNEIGLANFEAKIIRETRIIDGQTTETILTVAGTQQTQTADGTCKTINLPEVEVDAGQFAGMSWVMQSWGVRAIIFPVSNVKEDLRASIQLHSSPEQRTIYKSIGWSTIDGQPAYLHATGAITWKGNNENVMVRLPMELQKYDLSNDNDPETCFSATLKLLDIGPRELTWPTLAATFAPLYGPIDFAIHIAGRTGTFKSEFISLFQSHFGPEMDARNLPASWSSTANALEAQAYFAANAPMVIDDFVPTGTSWQVKSYQTTADKIIRAQGNQAGRARLTDTSNLQKTYYPRGLIMSTGEDTPEGHSVRARMLIMEMTPGDIDVKKLSNAQLNRPLYTGTTAALIQDLCRNPVSLKARSETIRNSMLNIGHTRTPPMIGRLIATAEHFLDWAARMNWITKQQLRKLHQEAYDSIIATGRKQQFYLENADPVELFAQGVRAALSTGNGHARTLSGGVPRNPAALGWIDRGDSDMKMWKSQGACIGYIDWDAGVFYFDVDRGMPILKKTAGNDLTLTRQTLLKRLKDAGKLAQTDDARQRNTIRKVADGHPRIVIALYIPFLLETEEVPDEEEASNVDRAGSGDDPFEIASED